MKQKLLFLLMIAAMPASSLFAQNGWPKNISLNGGGTLTMYEPQPEKLAGDQLTGRAAVSVKKSASEEPVFGVVFFNAALRDGGNTDNDRITSMTITHAKFSGLENESEIEKYSTLLEDNASSWNIGMSQDELQQAIDREKSAASGADFNNAAPEIIYANKPSTLVVLDGEPKLLYDEKIKAEKVANSPNLIIKESNQWHLYAGGNWYKSKSLNSGWKINNNLSSRLKKVNEAVKKQEQENNNGQALSSTPTVTDIIVTTRPSELLQTNGDPEYKAVAGTSLLYVSNSPNEIFKDIHTQKTYILIAGRWYNASDLRGPWSYVPSDKLPEDFAKIPAGSDKDNVLANVAGTDEAEDAIVNAAVPQTAKVDKRTATIHVEYDGTPVFNQIEGTSLELAENSNVTVMIDASGRYFALENGIWFTGKSAYGPWKVANERPQDVDDIPANSPAYNSRYVYIYDETPDYVYMGYTSGYLGSYYYGPTMVYGTGWHYRPWYRSMYYPRPMTWGFGFMYDPWIGWNMNWGFNYGFLYVGFNYGGYDYGRYGYGYGGGWFGPRYYCPPYRRNYYGGYYGHYNDYYGYNDRYSRRNDYGYDESPRNPNGTGSRPNRRQATPANNQGSGWSRNYNLYNNQNGVVTQNPARTPRVYQPLSANNNNANLSNRYSNRLQQGSGRAPVIENDSRVNNDTRSNIGRPDRLQRNPEQREPVIHNRQENSNRNIGELRESERRAYRPQRSQETTPVNEAPVIRRPSTNDRVENPARAERQLPQRSAPVERQERSHSPRNEMPQHGSRPSIQRESAPQRSQTPNERPSFNNRSSAPQSGGSNGGALPRGRPDRR